MSSEYEPTIAEALDSAANAIKRDDLETGKTGLKWVLERDPNNVLAWLWMSRCVESAEQKLECFNHVLAIDPSNKHALDGVHRYGAGEKIQETPARQPPSSAAPSTQASTEQSGSVESNEKPKRRRLVMIIGGGLLLLCMCSFGAVLLAPDSDEATPVASVADESQAEQPPVDSGPAEPTDAPPPTTAPDPTSTPAPVAPPYQEIVSTVAGMTEAQWKAYLPTLEGNQVVGWSGWVVEVDVNLDGSYELWVDMDPPDTLFSAQDVYFDIPDEIALELQLEQQVTFSGTIGTASELLGSVSFILEDVTLEQ